MTDPASLPVDLYSLWLAYVTNDVFYCVLHQLSHKYATLTSSQSLLRKQSLHRLFCDSQTAHKHFGVKPFPSLYPPPPPTTTKLNVAHRIIKRLSSICSQRRRDVGSQRIQRIPLEKDWRRECTVLHIKLAKTERELLSRSPTHTASGHRLTYKLSKCWQLVLIDHWCDDGYFLRQFQIPLVFTQPERHTINTWYRGSIRTKKQYRTSIPISYAHSTTEECPNPVKCSVWSECGARYWFSSSDIIWFHHYSGGDAVNLYRNDLKNIFLGFFIGPQLSQLEQQTSHQPITNSLPLCIDLDSAPIISWVQSRVYGDDRPPPPIQDNRPTLEAQNFGDFVTKFKPKSVDRNAGGDLLFEWMSCLTLLEKYHPDRNALKQDLNEFCLLVEEQGSKNNVT
jgi:hypothetical protein